MCESDMPQTSKPPSKDKGGHRGKEKPAIQQWQTDLLLHKKQRLTLEKCIFHLHTKYYAHNFRGFRDPTKPLRNLWVLD